MQFYSGPPIHFLSGVDNLLEQKTDIRSGRHRTNHSRSLLSAWLDRNAGKALALVLTSSPHSRHGFNAMA
jgi:hypothetical protein